MRNENLYIFAPDYGVTANLRLRLIIGNSVRGRNCTRSCMIIMLRHLRCHLKGRQPLGSDQVRKPAMV